MAQTKVNPVWVDEENFFIGLTPSFVEVGNVYLQLIKMKKYKFIHLITVQ